MLIQHRWQLISGAENIADFSPSVQQINPPWQLENTFSPANESRPLSYFPFFTIAINWWLTLDASMLCLEAGYVYYQCWDVCLLSPIKVKECLMPQSRYFTTLPDFHVSAKVSGVLIKTFPSFQDFIAPQLGSEEVGVLRKGWEVWSVRSTLRIPQGGPFCLPSHWHWLTLLSKGGGCYFAQSHTCYRWFLCRCLFFQLNIV